MKTSNLRRAKQAGFTIIELMIVLGILALLIAALTAASRGKGDAGKAAIAGTHIEKDIVEGLYAYASVNRMSIDGATKADITAREIDGNTIWGAAWTMTDPTANDNSVTLAYPIGSRSADNVGPDLAASLSVNNAITATYAPATDTLTAVITGP